MQTNVETLSQLERRITMAVPADDINKKVEQRLRQLSRTVRMAGFRPGKVPMKIVEQQYGPQVRSEVLGDAVQKEFSDAVSAQNLRIAGNPKIEPQPNAGDGKIGFSATFEVYPEITLADLSAAAIERPVLEVSDADVDNTIEILRKQRTTWHEVQRAAGTGDRVTANFTGRIDGTEFAGGKGEGVAVVLGEGRMLPDFEKGLTGMTAGQTGTFEVKFPDDYAGKEVAGKTASFETTVTKVEEPKLPEVDAEFAKGLGVDDGDVAKMRQEIRANVEREVKKRLEGETKQRVMQALIDANQVELPKSLVEIETQGMVERARNDLQMRGLKIDQLPIEPSVFETQAKRRVTLGLIIGELIKANGLTPKPDQIKTLVEEYAQTYEQPGEVVRWIYSDQQRLAEFEGMAIESNVVTWVLGKAKVSDKPIGFDELMGRNA